MQRIMITAALLAAFAVPAIAGETTIKTGDTPAVTRLDASTTSSTASKQSDAAPTAVRDGMNGGCTHRKSTALNMM